MAEKKSTKKKAEPYKASVKILGKTYKSTGSTLTEVISKLEVPNARGMGILSITKGGESVERIFSAPVMNRLFCQSPMMREIAIKSISLTFDI